MSSSTIRTAVSVLAVLLSVSYLIYDGVSDTMVYYLTVPELKSESPDGRRFRVSGAVKEGSVFRTPGGGLVFSIAGGGDTVPVSYKGVVPDTFREGVEAVVEGTYGGAGFEADLLLAKCPTKYEPGMPERE